MSGLETQAIAPVHLAQQASFCVGLMEVRPATREVIGAGLRRILEPRIMQVLVVLARADGRVVSREELVARCWDGRIVGDNALHRAVGRLRRLATAMNGSVFTIETIPRVGYRLLADLQPADALTVPIVASSVVPINVTPPVSRRLALLGVATTLLAGAGVGVRWRLEHTETTRQIDGLLEQSHYALRLDLPDAAARGEGFLVEAARLDPGDPRVWGALALTRCIMAEYASPAQRGGLVAGTEEAARRALSLEARQPDALAALAQLPPSFGDWLAAEQRLRSVLSYAPTHLPSLDALGFFLGSVGRIGEAAHARLLYSPRDPLNAGLQYRLVYAYWMLGRLDEADRAADRALQLWPRHPAVWLARLWTLAFTGRSDRALAHVSDLPGRPEMPGPLFVPLELSMRAIDGGGAADRERASLALMDQIALNPSASVNAVMLLTAMGDLDRAFAVTDAYLLERGPVVAGLHWRSGQPSVNDQHRRKTAMLFVPACEALRADSRFADLTRAVGLDAYWDAARVTPDYRVLDSRA